ncbi:hypothetical protein AJ79_09382 [Helicocarpus griseus UAMH5409]|uniref:Major facilitator superfamily (MFS) profile domain-containing protein n=1 Tax=Helicocarpus griseus UAMH5409 TaxID=1447875 RepID=A0A2B7WJP7_9EURO|nr:hypothetical protein AJ79_09382 [Helicocarpus griseus UAMH5409]
MAANSATLEKVAAHHLEDTLGHGAIIEAKNASDEEHAQTLAQAIRANWKAVFWSVMISMSIIMEGFDTLLISNFFGYPEFRKKYGQDYGGDIGYQLSGPWQTGLSMASTVGAIFGGSLNGYVASKFGYRLVMIYGLMFMNAFIFVVFFAPSAPVLLVGQILCGLAWGVFATIGPSYASEVCPTNLRGYLTMYVNLCWAIGQLIAAGVLYGLVDRPDEWAYRIPFALQWLWPTPLIVLCYFAPESPWFLARKERLEEARHAIRRLGGNKTEDQINGQLAMIVHTIKIETETQSGIRYTDCFKGVDLRRTEICCIAFAGQILSGSSFAYAPSYFFVTAGMDENRAYQLNVGGTAIAFVGTILSWFLITYFGRRTLYLTGQSILFVVLMIIGIANAASHTPSSLWAQSAFCILWLFTYSLTVGPLAYAIISETSSIRLRPLTVSLARISYQLTNIVSQVLQVQFMNPTEWNLSGKTGFFWACTCFCIVVWAYFRLPEAKGRTYEEMDILFARGISARKFAETEVDAYAELQGGVEQEGAKKEEQKEG